jgi:tetratricopeptide (TPR) repeat protein
VGVVALVVVAVVVGAYVVTPATDPEAVAAAARAEAQARQQAMDDRVVRIAREIDAAVRNGRDLAPMIEELRSVIAEHPDHAEARRAIALAIGSRGDLPAEAYDHLIRTLDADDPTAEMHAIAGNLALQTDDLDAAIAHSRRAVAVDPDEPRFTKQLAMAHDLAGDDDDALRLADAWVARASDLPDPFLLKAELLVRSDRLDDAERTLRQALERTMPDETQARLDLALRRAELLRRLDRPAEALVVLRRLSLEEQLTRRVADDLAATWDRLGQPRKAAVHYERIARMQPAATWAARQAAERYAALDDADKAATMRALLPR